jgi:NTE family protein
MTAMLIQSSVLAKPAALDEASKHVSHDAQSQIESEVVSDSFEKEKEQSKSQIEQSAPEDDVKSLLPPSGQVMSPKQKQEAGKEATQIINDTRGSSKKISSKNPDGTPTIALALGGGGARGAAHIGVLKVFEEEGIHVNQIVGNSMGAIVGGLYSAGLSLDDIKGRLEDLSLRKAYMPGGIAKKLVSLPLSGLLHPFRPKHYAGLWSGEKLTRYFDQILPRPNMDISETKIPFSSVATNLLDGKAYRITKGRLATAIKASAAITPIIQPVAIGNKLFVDGGVRANLPASAARDTGAGLVIAVLVDEPMQVLPAKQFTHLKNVVSRMSDIVLSIADERQLQFADLVINPDVTSIPVLSNDPADVQKAVHAGELAARKAIPELRRRMKSTNH